MPTYDYRCKECGHEFELFQAMSASVKKKCPECKRMALERLIGTGAAVIFKGSGFYETDYRSDSYKKAAKADQKAAEAKPEKKETAAKKDDSPAKKSKEPAKKPASKSKD